MAEIILCASCGQSIKIDFNLDYSGLCIDCQQQLDSIPQSFQQPKELPNENHNSSKSKTTS